MFCKKEKRNFHLPNSTGQKGIGDWAGGKLQLRVRVGETYSKPHAVDYSVPQGSVVGPQLFSAYASTLDDVVMSEHNISLYGFADDHVLSWEIDLSDPLSERRSMSGLEECLKCVKEWMDCNRLK